MRWNALLGEMSDDYSDKRQLIPYPLLGAAVASPLLGREVLPSAACAQRQAHTKCSKRIPDWNLPCFLFCTVLHMGTLTPSSERSDLLKLAAH